MSRCGGAPVMTREPRTRAGNDVGNRAQLLDGNVCFLRCIFKREARIQLEKGLLEAFERAWKLGSLVRKKFIPIPPATDELAIVASSLDEIARNREKDGGFAPRLRCDPIVGVR